MFFKKLYLILPYIWFGLLIVGCASHPTIKMNSYQSEILMKVPENPVIFIGLISGTSAIQISTTESLTVLDKSGDEIIKAGSDVVWTFEHVVSENAQGPRDVWQLQLAAYKNEAATKNGMEEIRQLLPSDVPIHVERAGDWHKVRAGIFDQREDAIELQKKVISKAKFTDCFPIKVTLPATENGHIRVITPEGESLGFLWMGPLKIISNKGHLTFEKNPYRGQFEIGINSKGDLYLANQISISEYLQGVLPAEMNGNWHLEALKAQAVVARTYLINQLESHLPEGFNVCNKTHCQVYRGMKGETNKANRAIAETVGEILVHKGVPIKAVYSACCGGFSETAENVWGSKSELKYLRSRADSDRRIFHPSNEKKWEKWINYSMPKSFCNHEIANSKDIFRWEVARSSAEVSRSINKFVSVGTVQKILPRERGKSGRLKRITIIGSSGKADIKRELRIRQALGGLRSSAFVVKSDGDSFKFKGAGYGHGVGMCQIGAVGMAEKGYNYRKILDHYYHDCKIHSIWESTLYSSVGSALTR